MFASRVHGLHHVTAIAGDPAETYDFYTRVLGLRLVKRSVNQDAPGTYHLFFADAAGTPGTDLTFFPWPEIPAARPGTGTVAEVAFAVPTGTLGFWQDRLAAEGIALDDAEERFWEHVLPFADPHGLRLALVETDGARPFAPWAGSPVAEARQVRGMHSVRLLVERPNGTDIVLTEVLGFRPLGATPDGWQRYAVDDAAPGCLVEVKADADAPHGTGGVGGVHHVAWRVPDSDAGLALRRLVADVGLQPSPQIDRFWFESVYFREPGGILFELATDGPGFDRDEAADHLGETLILPPWLEPKRAAIEAALPPLVLPAAATG